MAEDNEPDSHILANSKETDYRHWVIRKGTDMDTLHAYWREWDIWLPAAPAPALVLPRGQGR